MVNPTYKGWVISRTRSVQVKGMHEAIIGESTFEAVQHVLSGNGNHQGPHVMQNEDFPSGREDLNSDPLPGFSRGSFASL